MDIDATPSGASANSYLTLDAADELMEGCPDALDAWDDLEEDRRVGLLVRGTRLIDRYRDWGPPKVAGQRLRFPRGVDKTGEIPLPVQNALIEFCAFQLADDAPALKQLQAEGVSTVSVLGQSMAFTGPGGAPDTSELPAGARRELDSLVPTVNAAGVVARALDGSSDPGSIFG